MVGNYLGIRGKTRIERAKEGILGFSQGYDAVIGIDHQRQQMPGIDILQLPRGRIENSEKGRHEHAVGKIIEQMLIQIRNAVDNNGKRIRLTPKKIVAGPSQIFQAEVLLKSVLRAGTANNDINPIKSMGLLSDGQASLSRITSTTAWWVGTDAPRGLQLLTRRKMEKSMEGDFETDSMRYKSTERYIPGWTDPRGVYGTPGL